MKQLLVVVIASLLAGFLLQSVIALAAWRAEFHGTAGWTDLEFDDDDSSPSDLRVRRFDRRMRAWQNRNAFGFAYHDADWLTSRAMISAYTSREAYEAAERDNFWPTLGSPGPSIGSVWMVRCGWPFRSLGGTSTEDWIRSGFAGAGPPKRYIFGVSGLAYPSFDTGDVRLTGVEGLPVWPVIRARDLTTRPIGHISVGMAPTRLYLSGTIGNTLVWAMVAFGIFVGARSFRRWDRRRRGLCMRCRYELGALPTCPECGSAMPVEHSA